MNWTAAFCPQLAKPCTCPLQACHLFAISRIDLPASWGWVSHVAEAVGRRPLEAAGTPAAEAAGGEAGEVAGGRTGGAAGRHASSRDAAGAGGQQRTTPQGGGSYRWQVGSHRWQVGFVPQMALPPREGLSLMVGSDGGRTSNEMLAAWEQARAEDWRHSARARQRTIILTTPHSPSPLHPLHSLTAHCPPPTDHRSLPTTHRSPTQCRIAGVGAGERHYRRATVWPPRRRPAQPRQARRTALDVPIPPTTARRDDPSAAAAQPGGDDSVEADDARSAALAARWKVEGRV